jgi:hypothetical protein
MDTSQPATEQQPEDSDARIGSRMSNFERATLRWTGAMVLVTLGTGVFIGLQWREIRSSSVDTHELAVAAKSQSDNTESLAKSASNQVDRLRDEVEQLKRGADETHNLVTESQRSSNLAKSNAIKELRPYVFTGELEAPVFTENTKASWNIHFTNYGRSPAVRLLIQAQVVFGPDSEKKIRSNVFQRIHTPEHAEQGKILPPGDKNFTTAQSDEVLTTGDVDYIKTHDAGMVMLIHVEYFDMSGIEYNTEICMFRLITGAVANCDVHNVIR